MGSKRSTYQVQDDRQTLGKYPIRFRVRIRVQMTMEQSHELIIVII